MQKTEFQNLQPYPAFVRKVSLFPGSLCQPYLRLTRRCLEAKVLRMNVHNTVAGPFCSLSPSRDQGKLHLYLPAVKPG